MLIFWMKRGWGVQEKGLSSGAGDRLVAQRLQKVPTSQGPLLWKLRLSATTKAPWNVASKCSWEAVLAEDSKQRALPHQSAWQREGPLALTPGSQVFPVQLAFLPQF